MAVPKRKMSRSATRSRKSANMRLAPPAHSLCPNCGASRLPTGCAATAAGTEAARSSTSSSGARPVPPVIAIDAMGGDRARGDRRGRAPSGRGVRRRRPARRPAGAIADHLPAARPPPRRGARRVRSHRDGRRARRRGARQEGLVDRPGAEAVRDGRAAAMVGAGNTGATMAAALLRFGRIKGVHRPAIAIPVPVFGDDRMQLLVDGRHRRPRSRVARRVGRARARLRPRAARRRRTDRSRCCRTARSRARATRCASAPSSCSPT